MNKKLNLDPEDVALFRQSIGKVVAVKQKTVVMDKPLSTRPHAIAAAGNTSSHYFEEFVPEEFRVTSSDYIQFKRSGLQDKVFHKLKRGQLPIKAYLDLHGMTTYNAKLALDQFLAQRRQIKNQSCIRVIHGKGYGSKDGRPKIKQYIQIWLQNDKNVLGYASCTPTDGGTGAIYLLLKGGQN